MMNEQENEAYEAMGHATLGNSSFNATRDNLPAELKATSNELTLRVAKIVGWESDEGIYRFKPNQITKLEIYKIIPFLIWGIRVRHNIANYPKDITFSTANNPQKVLDGIKASGFITKDE